MARVAMFLAACGLAAQTVKFGPLTEKERSVGPKPGVRAAGVHRAVSSKMLGKGKWKDGVWRLRIISKGAKGLRLHVTGFVDGKLSVRGAGAAQSFAAKGPNGDGDFWTGVVDGESVWVEYLGSKRAGPPIGIAVVSHLW